MLPIVYYDIDEVRRVQGWTADDIVVLMVACFGLFVAVALLMLLVVSL